MATRERTEAESTQHPCVSTFPSELELLQANVAEGNLPGMSLDADVSR
jgi:hypothetical protein